MAEPVSGLALTRRLSKVLSRGLAHILVGGACAATVALAPHWTAVGLLAAGSFLFLLFDYARSKEVGLYLSLSFLFRPFLRESEGRGLSGAFFMLAGCLFTSLFFSQSLALIAVLFLTFGDIAATLVGSWHGRTRIGNKSLEGSLACLAMCILVAVAAHLLRSEVVPQALSGGVVAATLLEALPWKINDNLSLPLGSAAVMLGISRLVS